MDVKAELEKKAAGNNAPAKITKSMSIADLIKTLEPEIRKALPSVISTERFTRMALSALNNNPQLMECTQMSFLAALMNAAQLGLEPNTPLGQAYLIPYKNKGKLECQFQLGFKGMIDLIYRNENVQTIQAHCVHENDEFVYSYGLNPRLEHIPSVNEKGDRGEVVQVYAMYKLANGGYGFEVLSRREIDRHAEKYSKSFGSDFSPWRTDYDSMAKKTVIKKLLKYAPLKTDVIRAVSTDSSIKNEIAVDMSEIANEIEVEEVA